MTFLPTRRWTVLLGGSVFTEWTRVEVSRDLEDLAGKFSLELRDGARSWSAFPFATLAGMAPMVEAGLDAEILLDGVSILRGWVNKIAPRAAEGQTSVSVTGCDKTGDLTDCAASVAGPFEYYGQTLDQVGAAICAPYGLTCRAEADVGRPFDRYAIDVGETPLSAIEKGARQRGLLVTSDGGSGLILTQSGQRRAGGGLFFPGNVTESSGEFSVEDRYSEYHVKGQAERAGGRRRKRPRLSVQQAPATRPDLPDWLAQQAGHEAGGTAVYGTARDGAGRRYRPLVAMGRTQLDDESAQTQAEWMSRTARGRGESLDYTVKDYYAPGGGLWRPNEIVPVSDSFQQVFRDMLIAGVSFGYDEQSAATSRLRLCGPDAYDTAPTGNRRRNSGKGKALDSTPHSFTGAD